MTRWFLSLSVLKTVVAKKSRIKVSTWVRCIRIFMGIYFPSSSPFFISIPLKVEETDLRETKAINYRVIITVFIYYSITLTFQFPLNLTSQSFDLISKSLELFLHTWHTHTESGILSTETPRLNIRQDTLQAEALFQSSLFHLDA